MLFLFLCFFFFFFYNDYFFFFFFFFQAEDGIRDHCVTGVQTCALPISPIRRAQANRCDETALPVRRPFPDRALERRGECGIHGQRGSPEAQESVPPDRARDIAKVPFTGQEALRLPPTALDQNDACNGNRPLFGGPRENRGPAAARPTGETRHRCGRE